MMLFRGAILSNSAFLDFDIKGDVNREASRPPNDTTRCYDPYTIAQGLP